MEAKLKELVAQGIQELYKITDATFSIEYPKELSHGDYATNAAMVLAKRLGKNPSDIASELASYIENNKGEEIEKVSTAGQGFVNITLSNNFIISQLKNIFDQKENWGSNTLYRGKTILVEHSSPNLFKPFHIGHAMNNAIGESIVRHATFSGANVKTISFPSDISLGIAKAVWVMLQDGEDKINSFENIQKKIDYIGECYVRGTVAYDEQPEVQTRVKEIVSKMYENIPGIELQTFESGKKLSLEYFKDIVKKLGSEFSEGYIYESEAGEEGLKIVTSNIGNIFKESEGAVIYEGEQDGLHTRVFVNKEGYPTYEAKDIGLLSLKFSRFNPDLSIFMTDHQQEESYKVVLAAAVKINPEWKEKTIHRTHGRMSFQGKKMSSRLGGVPTALFVIESIKEELIERSPDITESMSEDVAIASLKFAILKVQAGKNINFDPDTSLSFEGDSGPYLQYTAVRIKSLLEKAKEVNLFPSFENKASISEIEHLLMRFPGIVERATREWAPHHVVGYLLDLAQTFNSWYGRVKLIDTESTETPYRLALAQSVQQTLLNGLWLLGIKTPERM